MEAYTGIEPAIAWHDPPTEPGAFVVRPPGLPPAAVPLYDDETQAVIGFRWESARGVYRIYDLQGEFVSMYEEPLQAPTIDPTDAIFVVGGALRSAVQGAARLVSRTAIAGGMRGLMTSIGAGAAMALRASMRRLLSTELKFTAKTAAWMATKGRYVPVHILKLAIRHGKRAPDPQGAVGAFEYTIPMVRNGVDYTLKVILREADNTILHFHYFY